MKQLFLLMLLFMMIFQGIFFTSMNVYADNSLENIHLIGINEKNSIDIRFVDELDDVSKKNISIDNIALVISDEEIQLSEPQLKITPSNKYFRIFSEPEDILIHGYKNLNDNNYKINILHLSHDNLKKYSILADIHYEEKEYLENENTEKNNSLLDLKITSSHDFRTFWKDSFNIDIQSFDGRINPNPKQSDFNGRIDGVDVIVNLSLDDVLISTLSGVTSNNGHWEDEFYVKENISAPGEYTVDITATYLESNISKSSSMFVIADVDTGSSSSSTPIANAGSDYTVTIPIPGCPCDLNGSASSDPSGSSLIYLWTQKSGTPVVILDENAQTTTFTSVVSDTYVFELKVTNSDGKTDSDTVVITLTL